jgi:hypothetical protein
MSPARQKSQFRTEDFGPATDLEFPLNDFALEVEQRLAALEGQPKRKLLRVKFTTRGSIGYRVVPFPLTVGCPFTPAGLILVGLYASTSVPLAQPPAVEWVPVSGGIQIVRVWGVAVSTSYTLAMEAISG